LECCTEPTATCIACGQGISVSDYCFANAETEGCAEYETDEAEYKTVEEDPQYVLPTSAPSVALSYGLLNFDYPTACKTTKDINFCRNICNDFDFLWSRDDGECIRFSKSPAEVKRLAGPRADEIPEGWKTVERSEYSECRVLGTEETSTGRDMGLLDVSTTNFCANVQCTAQSQCHEAGECDPETGTCSNPTKREGEPCDDGDPATVDDQCIAGACRGSATCATTPFDCSGESTNTVNKGAEVSCSGSAETCNAAMCCKAPEVDCNDAGAERCDGCRRCWGKDWTQVTRCAPCSGCTKYKCCHTDPESCNTANEEVPPANEEVCDTAQKRQQKCRELLRGSWQLEMQMMRKCRCEIPDGRGRSVNERGVNDTKEARNIGGETGETTGRSKEAQALWARLMKLERFQALLNH